MLRIDIPTVGTLVLFCPLWWSRVGHANVMRHWNPSADVEYFERMTWEEDIRAISSWKCSLDSIARLSSPVPVSSSKKSQIEEK